MRSLAAFWNGLDWTVLMDMLMRVLPALICITLHELAHGYAACRLGDPTAKRAGRLTLNPIRHIDPMGLLSMVVFRFGWAKPVPVNMYYFQNPKRGMAITALAGPGCNVLLALLFLFLYGLGFPLFAMGELSFITELCYITAYLSLSLAVFNLLPVPPLDGSKVLFSLLSDENYRKLMRYERYGMFLLLLLLWSDILARPLSLVTEWLFDRLFFAAEWGFELTKGLL